ncbi:MAG: radical SAM protein [Candidatus Lokiarchaeota archaeon]|nr:radical SAM protein [Candidatus Lokiarchaeota archaeon]
MSFETGADDFLTTRYMHPLGLISLATYAKQHGHEVTIIDQGVLNLTNEKLVERVKKLDPDVVGIGALSKSISNAKAVAFDLKTWNPNLKIVFGNYMATFSARHMLENYPWLDACVRGEGEVSFKELLDAWDGRRPIEDVTGVSFKAGGRIKDNPDRALIMDLDTLPMPDRSMVSHMFKDEILGIKTEDYKGTSMYFSRGCPYACTFCACRMFTHGTYRVRSVDKFMNELCEVESMGIKRVILVDDNFTLRRKLVIKLCEGIKKEKLDIFFSTEGRVNQSDYTMLREMKLAGVSTLFFGFESGVQRILDYYNKQITPDMSRVAIKHARKAGIDAIIGTFIVGGYDETYEEVNQTINFIKSVDIDFPQLVVARAFPGTPIYNDLVQRKLLDDTKYWEAGVDVIDLPGSFMKRQGLKRLVDERYKGVFFRPAYIARAFYRNFASKFRRGIVNHYLNPKEFRRLPSLFKGAIDVF